MFMALSYTSMLFAQVEIKSSSTSKKSDKTTDTKTTETKTDQKVNMGGYTKSGTQVNLSSTSTEPSKEPSSVADQEIRKSLPPSYGNVIYDRMGELMATIGPDGKLYNPKGELLGQYTAKGDYLGPNGELLGTMRDGVIRNKKGKELGRLAKDGIVTNAKGKLLGTIYDDGTIRNSKGSRLGSASGVDKNIAAIIFFIRKKPSGDRKQNTDNKPVFESKTGQR